MNQNASDYRLDTGNRLLLLQAINSIDHGLACLEWIDELPNENTWDALTILKDRFKYFKECAFDEGECDYLIIDGMKKMSNNIEQEYKSTEKIHAELDNLRKTITENKIKKSA